jgi:S-DNA-T family DNA segregation ATPase FtsK/SpoIIIE
LSPIITTPDKALKVLKWASMHMDERYTKLRKNKVRNIDEYNEKIQKDKMYRIVIVIDELADLMMSSSANRRDTELYIARIAQKARAV